jgi:hypothetical protein
MRRAGRGAVTLGLLGILALAGCEVRGGPGERIRGEGFELRCDPGCGPEGRALVADLAGTRDSVATWFGVTSPPSPPRLGREPLLRIRLYASPAAFLRADRRLASGRFADQRAFSHERSRSAHILAEGAPDPHRWQRFGPGFQGERLVVHEAAHLATYALAVDARWPSWVSEGVASQAEERWAASRSRVPEGRPGEPWLHTLRHTRQRLLGSGALPGIEAVLREDLANLPLGARYAVWGGWMGVLLDPPFRDRTQAFLAQLAGPPPPGGWSRGEVALRFEGIFDEAARSELDRAFRARVAGEPVEWIELRRSAGWTREGLLQLPVGEDPFLWRPAPPGTVLPAFRLRARVEVLGPGGGAGSGPVVLALGVAGWEEEAVGVRLSRDRAPERVRLPLGGAGAERVATAGPPRFPPDAGGGHGVGGGGASGVAVTGSTDDDGGVLAVELALENGVLTASVAGRLPVSWSMEGLRPTGGWGIGTGGATAALWRVLDPGSP